HRLEIGLLRSDVAAHPFEQQVLKLAGALIDCLCLADVDSEFVTQTPGSDMGVSIGGYVWIHTKSDTRLDSAAVRQRVHQGELGLRLAVERENSRVEGGVDLLRGLADARKNHLSRITAGFENPMQLAAGDDVEPSAGVRQQTQNRQVAVGFYRVAYGV